MLPGRPLLGGWGGKFWIFRNQHNIWQVNTGAIACKHRNKNEGCGTQQVFYKGKHSKSFSSSEHKMGAMIGTCYRIQRNSFNDDLLQEQMKEKTREWRECLQYSHKFIASAIKYLANKHTDSVWEEAHKQLVNTSAWRSSHKPGVLNLTRIAD